MTSVCVATGKVAAIISEYQLALNLGTKNGVAVGDDVTISRTIKVNDPDSGDYLGMIGLPKLRLKVMSVGEKLSLATVTDRVPARVQQSFMPTAINTQPFKRITSDPFETEDSTTVYVEVGEAAEVLREEASSEGE